MRIIIRVGKRILSSKRTCRFCGYSGSDRSDSDECPSCGEIN